MQTIFSETVFEEQLAGIVKVRVVGALEGSFLGLEIRESSQILFRCLLEVRLCSEKFIKRD